MTTAPSPHPDTTSHQTLLVLKTLRVSLHVMFAFLLCLGATLALIGSAYQPRHTALGILSLLLGTVYLAGTVYENRQGLPATYTALIPRPGTPATYQTPPRFTPTHLWLTTITTLWLGLMCLDSSFTWVVFPIMFLYLHLLTPPAGVTATLVLCALSIALPLIGPAGFGWNHLHTHGIAPGYLIGPTLGALLSIVISYTYRALSTDANHNYRLAQQLRAVQAELAQQQYTAGKTAERERLAREIHDTLAQGLSSIVLVSRAAATALTHHNHNLAAQQIHIIQESAAANLAEARRFIKDLSSPALDTTLTSALTELTQATEATQHATGTSLTCTFVLEGNEAEANTLPDPLASTLLRVAQGALANVVAHAGASRVALTLTLWPSEVTLDVFDNGRGFDPALLERLGTGPAALTESGTGFGLPSLDARLAQLGGSLEIESAAGSGTVLTARLPLPDTTGVSA